ncbi:Mitochondrial distribution and morphology protein 12 [Tilletia horrida]|nr:Mitochondrial distribution and morphology protein 12 [Tilletia horrida]
MEHDRHSPETSHDKRTGSVSTPASGGGSGTVPMRRSHTQSSSLGDGASPRRPAMSVFQAPGSPGSPGSPAPGSGASTLGRRKRRTGANAEWHGSVSGAMLRDASTDDVRSVRSISSTSMSLPGNGRGPPTTLRRPTAVLGLNMDTGAVPGGSPPLVNTPAMLGGAVDSSQIPSNASMDDLSIASGVVAAAAAAAAAARYNYAAVLAQHQGSPALTPSASFGLGAPGAGISNAMLGRRGSASSTIPLVGSPGRLGALASTAVGTPGSTGGSAGPSSSMGAIPFPSSAKFGADIGAASPVFSSTSGSQSSSLPVNAPSPIIPASYSSFNMHPSIGGLGLGSGPGTPQGPSISAAHVSSGTSSAKSGLQTSADAMYRRMRGESLSRKYWMADEVAKECRECLSTFTIFRRKHHCRICGQIFCGRCASHIISFGENDLIRVCNFCLNMLDEYERSGAGLPGSGPGRENRTMSGGLSDGINAGSGGTSKPNLMRHNSPRVRTTSALSGAPPPPVEANRGKGLYALMGMNLGSGGGTTTGNRAGPSTSIAAPVTRQRTQSAAVKPETTSPGTTSSSNSGASVGGFLASLGLWGSSTEPPAPAAEPAGVSLRRGNSGHRQHGQNSFSSSRVGTLAGAGVGLTNFLTSSSMGSGSTSAGPPGRVRRDMISSPLEAQVRSPQAEFAANALFKRTLPATFGLDAQDAYLLALHQQQQQQQQQQPGRSGGRGPQFSGMPGWQGFGAPSPLHVAGLPPDTKLSAAALAQLRGPSRQLSAQERAMARVMISGGGEANAHDDADTDAGTDRDGSKRGPSSRHGSRDLGRDPDDTVAEAENSPVIPEAVQPRSRRKRVSGGSSPGANSATKSTIPGQDDGEAAPFRKAPVDDPAGPLDSDADADGDAIDETMDLAADISGTTRSEGDLNGSAFDRKHRPHLNVSDVEAAQAVGLDLGTNISLPEPGVGFLTPAVGTPTFAISPATALAMSPRNSIHSGPSGPGSGFKTDSSLQTAQSSNAETKDKDKAATKATRAVGEAAGITFPRSSSGDASGGTSSPADQSVSGGQSLQPSLSGDRSGATIPFASREDMQRVRLLSDVALRQAYQRGLLLSHPSGLAHLGADLNEMMLMPRGDISASTPGFAMLDPDESYNFARSVRRNSMFGMDTLTGGSRSGLMSRTASHGLPGGHLSELSLQHLHRMLSQVLERAGIKKKQLWEETLTRLLLQALASVRTNPRGGGTSDIRNYIKIKKVAGGKIRDSKYVNGVICTKNVATKRMAKNLPLRNCRVMIVAFPLDYHRSDNQFVSLEPMIAQEEEYTRILVARIVALRPQLLIVEKIVSRLALSMLEREGVTVVWSVKTSVIEAISRCTQADIISSMDRLALDPRLGRCAFFDVTTYQLADSPDKRKALMHFEGQSRDVAGTILIRGGSTMMLKRIKSILDLMVFVGNTLRLEEYLMQNEGATIIPPTPLVRPAPTVAKPIPITRALDGFSTSMDFVEEPENMALQAMHDKWQSAETVTAEATPEILDEDEALLQRCRKLINQLLKRYETTLLSASPGVHFPPPFPLLKLKKNDDRIAELKQHAEQEETAKILADERKDTSALPTPSESRAMSPGILTNPTFNEKGDPALLNLSVGSDISSLAALLAESAASEKAASLAEAAKKPSALDNVLQDPTQVAKEQEYPIAREKHLSQLRLWLPYLEHDPENVSPFSHQKLTLLVSTICSATLRPCEGPTQHTVEFYGFGDETLGEYVERTCINHTTICTSKGCDRQQLLHYKTYVHDQIRVQVVLERFVCPIPGEENRILLWSYCKLCEVATPVSPMSEEAWHYSFAKYLELHFYADKTWKSAMCNHDFYRDHVRYYAFKNLAIRFHSDPIDSMEIAVPEIKLQIAPKTRSALKNEEARTLQQRNATYWSTVVSRLRALASTPCPDRDTVTKEKGRQILGDLLKRCESHRKEIEALIARTYRNSGPFDVLALNTVCRALQEKVVQWDIEFSEFEKVYLPSDRDIRRLTTSHIKRLFDQKDSTERGAEALGLPAADEMDETASGPQSAQADREKHMLDETASTTSEDGRRSSILASSAASIISEPPESRNSDVTSQTTPVTPKPLSTDIGRESESGKEVMETDDEPSSPNVTRTPGQFRTPRASLTGRTEIKKGRSRSNTLQDESSCAESDLASKPQIASLIRRFEPPGGTVEFSTPVKRPHLRRINTDGSSPPLTKGKSDRVSSGKATEAVSDIDQMDTAPSVSSRASSPTRKIMPPPSRILRLGSRQSISGANGNTDTIKKREGPSNADTIKKRNTPSNADTLKKRDTPSERRRTGTAPPNSFSRFVKESSPFKRPESSGSEMSRVQRNGRESDTESSTSQPQRQTQTSRQTIKGKGAQGDPERPSGGDRNSLTLTRTISSNASTIKALPPPSRASRVPIPIPSKDNNTKSRVSTIARHFDRLSREAERERERNRQLMAIRSRRAQPVGVIQARVAVFSSMRDAVRDEDSDSDEDESSQTGASRRDGRNLAGETANDAEDEDSDAEQVKNNLAASSLGTSTGSVSPTQGRRPFGDETTNSTTSASKASSINETASESNHQSAASSLADSGKQTVAAIMDSITNASARIPGLDAAFSSVGPGGAGMLRTSGSETESAVSDRSSILKTLSGFLAVRAGEHLPLLEYPLSATEHLFADSRVILREDEPSSIIAFTLSSSNYRERLQSTHAAYQRLTARKESFMPGMMKRGSSKIDMRQDGDSSIGRAGQSEISRAGMSDFNLGSQHEGDASTSTAVQATAGDLSQSTIENVPLSASSSRFETASIRTRSASIAPTETGTVAGTDGSNDEAWDMIDVHENSSGVEAALNKPEGTHFKFEYVSGSTKFFCKIFFAEQFDALRRRCGCSESFIESLARCVKWDSIGGKSGSAFLKTKDDRLVVKQLSRAEMDGFSKFAPSYFQYLASCLFKDRPTTLAKVFGCFRIGYRNPQTGKNMKLDCMVMENLFYGREVSKIFDLKGSTRNRHIRETGKVNEVLLDENLVELAYQSPLFVRDHSKRLLRAALWNDSMFLAEMNVMDYSLIVGLDKSNLELVVGIIDFLRPYTWDKRVESFVKETGLLGGGAGKEPTIITPKMYRARFLAFLDKSFLMSPDPWLADPAPQL